MERTSIAAACTATSRLRGTAALLEARPADLRHACLCMLAVVAGTDCAGHAGTMFKQDQSDKVSGRAQASRRLQSSQ